MASLTLTSSLQRSQVDPFGDDDSDLPLGKYCEEIDKQITAIAERAKLKLNTCTDDIIDIERGPADLE